MKKVFQNTDLCHVFAQQSQDYGRGSNLFFEGKRIYSYGKHYLLAEFIEKDVIIINNEGYSSTTSYHITLVQQATRQYKQFFTKSVGLNLVYNSILDLNKRLPKAIKKEIICFDIIRLFESLKSFSTQYKPSNLKDAQYKEIEKIYKSISANKDEYILAQKERAKKAELKEAKKLAVDVKKFLNYELNYIKAKEDFIRVSKCGKFIESSQGVEVDIKEAKILYKMIANKQDIKGHKIDNYTVIGLNGVLSIGCHKVNTDNMHTIGKKICKLA